MKGILKGGVWDGMEVDVSEPPPEYVTVPGTPEAVYRIADLNFEGEGIVVVYSKK
jgi:hypothetical protein